MPEQHPSGLTMKQAALVVLAITYALFARTAAFDLVWDDHLVLENIRSIVRARGVGGLLSAEFIVNADQSTGYYRPVALASLWLDSLLPWPSVFLHLTNVHLHAICSLLTLVVLRRIVGSTQAALAGALVFAVHPVHVESVAFVSGRTDLLAALFLLAATSLWIPGGQGERPGASRIAIAAMFFGFACLSKEVSFAYPPVMLGWAALAACRGGDLRGALRRDGPWLLALFVVATAAAVLRTVMLSSVDGHTPLSGLMLSGSSMGLLSVKVVTYLRLAMVPWPLKPLYDEQDLVWRYPQVLGGLLFIALAVVAALRQGIRPAATALLWYGCFLAPVLGFVPILGSPIAERFLYLPSFGIAALVALAVGEREGGRRRVGFAMLPVGFAVLVLGAATFAQSGVWRDEIALFSTMANRAPGSVVAHYNLGTALRKEGRNLEAVEAFKAAIAINPDGATYYNLGNAHRDLGNTGLANRAYRNAVDRDRGNVGFLNNLAVTDFVLGKPGEAVELWQEALTLDPGNLTTHINLAKAYTALGDLSRAADVYGAVLRLDPDNLTARAELEALRRRAPTR